MYKIREKTCLSTKINGTATFMEVDEVGRQRKEECKNWTAYIGQTGEFLTAGT